jgi:hypothetical protein
MCKLVEEVVDNDTDYYEDYDGNDGELDWHEYQTVIQCIRA